MTAADPRRREIFEAAVKKVWPTCVVTWGAGPVARWDGEIISVDLSRDWAICSAALDAWAEKVREEATQRREPDEGRRIYHPRKLIDAKVAEDALGIDMDAQDTEWACAVIRNLPAATCEPDALDEEGVERRVKQTPWIGLYCGGTVVYHYHRAGGALYADGRKR